MVVSTARMHVGRVPVISRASAGQAGQVAVGMAAWAAFGAGWGRVVMQGLVASAVLGDVVLLAGLFLLVAVVTTGWIRHNEAIYRRRGPRLESRSGPGYPPFDRLGRRMVADVAALRGARHVVVMMDDDIKTFVQ